VPRMSVSYFEPAGGIAVFETAARSMTIGSGAGCDLRLAGLGPLECTIYLSEQGYYATNDGGRLRINGIRGPGFVQANDVLQLDDAIALRFNVVADTPPATVTGDRAPAAVGASRPAGVPVRGTAGAAARRGRSPAAAAVLSTVFPGAGQAYNGQLAKASLILVLAALVVPWLLGIWDAHRVAARSLAEGVLEGGGLWGVLLHFWFFADLALLALLALTLTGVLT